MEMLKRKRFEYETMAKEEEKKMKDVMRD